MAQRLIAAAKELRLLQALLAQASEDCSCLDVQYQAAIAQRGILQERVRVATDLVLLEASAEDGA
jgi:hypothetical protein